MTREEQIENIAIIADSIHSIDCFKAGVKWADSNPYWHKFPDEKPELKQRILIYTTSGRIVETVWHQPMLVSGEAHGEPTFGDNRYNEHNVIAWMGKPQPPKFD